MTVQSCLFLSCHFMFLYTLKPVVRPDISTLRQHKLGKTTAKDLQSRILFADTNVTLCIEEIKLLHQKRRRQAYHTFIVEQVINVSSVVHPVLQAPLPAHSPIYPPLTVLTVITCPHVRTAEHAASPVWPQGQGEEMAVSWPQGQGEEMAVPVHRVVVRDCTCTIGRV